MKKNLLILILVVAVGFLASTNSAFAQVSDASDSSMIATPEAQVNYTLAYPGILPDNPLYFLKAARDKLVSFLISDVEKKAEFDLLTSDKRISAAFTLAGEGKGQIAVTTLSKSNNYLSEAVADFIAAKKQGKDENSSLQNLSNAISKHEDMVAGIKNRLGKNYSAQVSQEAKRLENFSNSVNKYIKK